MKYIEFIGPSGVGKSTLLNHLITLPIVTKQNATLSDFIAYALSNNNSSIEKKVGNLKISKENGIKNNIHLLLIKLNLFRSYHKSGYTNFDSCYDRNPLLFFKNYFDIFYLKEEYKLLLEWHIKGIENLKNICVVKKVKLLQYYIDMLITKSFLDENLFQKTILFDEFLFHNNIGISIYGANLIDESTKSIINNTLPQSVIYCYNTFENIKNRIINRNEKTIQNIFHIGLNEEKIFEQIIQSIEYSENVKSFLNLFNVPIIEIDTSEPILHNTQQIYNFLT